MSAETLIENFFNRNKKDISLELKQVITKQIRLGASGQPYTVASCPKHLQKEMHRLIQQLAYKARCGDELFTVKKGYSAL